MKKRIEFENDSEKTKKLKEKKTAKKERKIEKRRKESQIWGNGQLFVPICF